MNNKSYSFNLGRILTRKLDFSFLQPPTTNTFQQAFRSHGIRVTDNEFLVTLGMRLLAEETEAEKNPVVSFTAEIEAHVIFLEPLEAVKNLTDLPMLPNILAIIYPFLREKAYSCFASNGLPLLMGPVNTIALVENWAKVAAEFPITDIRPVKEPQKG